MKEFQPLQIEPATPDSTLTPQQARFNALVRDVALWRAALAQWQQKIDRYQQVVEPVRRELLAAWREWVFALDTASLQPGLSRAERAQLNELLRETASALLAGDEDDAGLAALLSRHAHDAPAEEEGLAQLAHDWEQQADAAAARREQQAASRRAVRARNRRNSEAQEVSQSLRDVYRRLASALHPDRAPDAPERERKTVLMQQANQAYAEGNLLVLLELQLQAEQVDMARGAAPDPRRLQHYSTVLQEQLTGLQSEARRLEARFRAAVGMAPGSGLPSRKLDRFISAEAQGLRAELLLLRRQTKLLLDVDATRSWLRELRRA
jgi:hypothetical protein